MALIKVTGIKVFNKPIDGEAVNSGKLFVETDLVEGSDELQYGEGTATAAFSLKGGADAVKPLRGMKFPITIEADLRLQTDGKGRSQTYIHSFRVPAPAPRQAA
jgi:hypothetical protein